MRQVFVTDQEVIYPFGSEPDKVYVVVYYCFENEYAIICERMERYNPITKRTMKKVRFVDLQHAPGG